MFVYNAKFAYLLTVEYIGRVFVSDKTVSFVCFSLLSLLLLLLLLLLSWLLLLLMLLLFDDDNDDNDDIDDNVDDDDDLEDIVIIPFITRGVLFFIESVFGALILTPVT